MQAVDHQHVVSAGAAEVIGPDAFQFLGFADEGGFQHSGRVGIVGVQLLDAGQRGGAQSEDGGEEAGAAAAGLDGEPAAGGDGHGPIDVLAGQVALVVERAGILKIAHAPDAAFELDELAVAELGRQFSVANGQAGLRARGRGELDGELVAAFVERRRAHHAAAQRDDLAGARVDVGFGAGAMHYFEQRAGRCHGEEAAAGEHPAGSQCGEQGAGGENRQENQQVARVEPGEARNQDTGGERQAGEDKRVSHAISG